MDIQCFHTEGPAPRRQQWSAQCSWAKSQDKPNSTGVRRLLISMEDLETVICPFFAITVVEHERHGVDKRVHVDVKWLKNEVMFATCR